MIVKSSYCTLLMMVMLPLWLAAQSTRNHTLNGQWNFAIDPLKTGEGSGWHTAGFAVNGFDKVQVPHCFSVDARYFFYTGTAWYFKQFAKPVVPAGYRTWLRFDAVFYKATVWVNGKRAGSHEGGYTSFEIDITDHLQTNNRLTLAVNNEWDTTTIPGAKTSGTSPANAAQMVAWMNYGGITRPVQLMVRPAVLVQQMQVMTDVDNKKGDALVRIKAKINNSTTQPVPATLVTNIYYGKQKLAFSGKPVSKVVAANGSTMVVLEGKLPAAVVKRWYPDDAHMYEAEVICNNDTLTSTFGIRKVEVKGTQLLLNGEPVRLGGANRPLDYPDYIHELYPNKPVYISEFGIRATERNTEENRIAYFKKAMEDFRQCDYLVGASVWSFNDYMSRFPGTDANGYRAWGLVTPERQLRPAYSVLQAEFAPVVLQTKKEGGQLVVQVTARTNFPARTLRNYQLKYGNTLIKLNTLKPGESQQVKLPEQDDGVQLSVVQPGGIKP